VRQQYEVGIKNSIKKAEIVVIYVCTGCSVIFMNSCEGMNMRWYHKLYIGKTARSKRYKIVWKVKHRAGMLGVYLITLASNENNLLDIFDSSLLLQPHFKNEDLFIVGIAYGYDEAVEVATKIIEELYQKTGDFKIRQFLIN